MGARRESVIDWLVLGLMMRILIGGIVVLVISAFVACVVGARMKDAGAGGRSWDGKGWVGATVEEKIWLAGAFRKVLYRNRKTRTNEVPGTLSYLGPSFSNILGPCSCHSCLVIHMFSLSAICLDCQSLKTIVRWGFLLLTYNVCKHCATEEDHMSPPRRIFDSNFKFLEAKSAL